MHLQRTQVGVHAQRRAQRQQSLLRANLRVRVGPLRATDRAQQHRIGALAGVERGGRQRLAERVDGDAADRMLLELEFVAAVFGDRFQNGDGHCGDFGADAVAGQGDDIRLHAATFCRSC